MLANEHFICSDEFLLSSLKNLTPLIVQTIDNILYTYVDSGFGTSNRIYCAFANWLSDLLLKCGLLKHFTEGQSLQEVVISALVALSVDGVLDTNSSNNEDKDGYKISRRTLDQFVKVEEDYQNLNVGQLPKRLFGEKIIRKIAMNSIFDQANILMNQRFNNIGLFII